MAELHEYPYTQYEDCGDMGCFMGLCKRVGVKLAVVGDSLQLLDRHNFVLSQVKIYQATVALQDEEGHDLTAYIINAGVRDEHVIFTKGNGEQIVIDVPKATVAENDTEGNAITSYLKNMIVSGDALHVTRGDGSSFDVIVPFAIKAATTVDDKPLTTLAASMEVSGQNIILKDSRDNVISTIRCYWSDRAQADENGNNIRETYANSLIAGTTTIKLISKAGDVLSELQVPYSVTSSQDENGNLFLHDYAETLTIDNDGKRLDLLAHDGTLLSAVRVPWSDLSEHSNKAIERAEIVGDQIVFTTYEGTVVRLTIPYALRCDKDGLSNVITDTYLTRVTQDPVTGQLDFYNAEQEIVCSLVPDARRATYDGLDNVISDYIKTIVFDSQSKYLIATHGTGQSDSIRIEYSTMSWKDDIGNIIKNVYHKTLFIELDNENRYNLVGLNGEGSEITRLVLPELTGAADGGIVVNNHQISLTNEVQSRIYDFTYNANDEEIEVSVHTLTEP